MNKTNCIAILFVILCSFNGCKHDEITSPYNENAITSFDLIAPPTIGVINESAKTISLIVPYGTRLDSLTPKISVSSKATVTPQTGEARSFTNPVLYTVTAENGKSQSYSVTVTAIDYLFHNDNTISTNTEVIITFMVAVDNINGFRIQYIAHSQSMDADFNSVNIDIIDCNGNVILKQKETYASESMEGTPIPGYTHNLDFKNFSAKKGDIIKLRIAPYSPWYKNYITDLYIFDYSSLKLVEAPQMTPNGGTYTTPQSVTITSGTEGADIYYTIDGSTPRPVQKQKYTVPIVVVPPMTIQAIAVKSGLKNSTIVSESYKK